MKVVIVLFENFETLGVFGPVEILGRLPETFEIDYYSLSGELTASTQGVGIQTKKLGTINFPVDILLIPGGKGTRIEINNKQLIDTIQKLSLQSRFVLTVCTGSALLAQTTLIDQKIATSNKRSWEWVISTRNDVYWQKKARWTVDGKYYTSSGISAGMDMTLGFIADIISKDIAKQIAFEMEYDWNSNSENDKFCNES